MSRSTVASGWNPEKRHSDIERWICIYPAYINSVKTLAQGRRIAKENCVLNPNHQEIREVLLDAGFKVVVENKLYSRERSKEVACQGRIRVQLKNDDGTPINMEYTTRDSILNYLGTTIPKLKTRANRNNQPQPHQNQQASAQSSAKGKGKKGRR